MAKNVVRQDVVQLLFDTNLKDLTKITKELDDLKRKMGLIDDSEIEKIGTASKKAEKSVNALKSSANRGFDDMKKGAKGFKGGLQDVQDEAKNTEDVFKSAFGHIKTAIAGAGVAFGVKELFGNANDYKKALNDIQARTGATADEMKEYKNIINDLYTDNFGENITDVANTMSLVRQVTGKTGDELKNASKNAILFRDTFDFDVNESIRASDMLAKQFGLDANQSYNLIAQGAQNGLDKNNDLLDTINEYSVHYKKLGFSAEQMMNSLVAGAESGTFSVDKLGDSIKEFSIRVIDGSESTKTGFATIGLNANEMAKEFGKGGDAAQSAFQKTVKALLDMKDPIKQDAAGVALFGTMWEDLGVQGITNMAKVTGAIDLGKNALSEINDIKYDDAASALGSLGRTINVSLTEPIGKAVNFAKAYIEDFTSGLKGESGSLDTTFGKLGAIFKKFLDNIHWIAPTILGIVGAIKSMKAINSVSNTVSGFFGLFKKSKEVTGNGVMSQGKSGNKSGIFGMFEGFAKLKVSTILKGIANITIILGTLSLLLLIAQKVFKGNLDFKELLKVIVLVGILGTVGAALAKFSGIVGLIPITTVLLGLANIAIVLTGMAALLFVASKVFQNGVDVSKMLKVIALIGILGAVGSVLSVFAGIVGLIPIPVVLAGIANIALVINGFAVLLAEFAALNKIPGFLDFMKSGGEVLITLFNILGKVAGSLIGGVGEGISNALPKIGENLGKFGQNVKPLFSSMQGVDLNSVGSFFTSLIGLLGIATGNEIVEGIKSFFGGGEESSLSKLGTELTNFSANAKGFFETAANMNTTGFTNARLMFDSLASLKNLPKDGGVVGWFSGAIDYDKLSAGLGKLASDHVVKFFNTVASIPEAGFNQAKLLFDTLAGLKSLPKDGGVAGWFSGNVDYNKISSGLGALSSEGVKNFFAMVGSFEKTAFDNAKLFFNTLTGINDMPKEGGLFGWAKAEVNLGSIGTQLSDFAKNAARFLTFVNNLNVENMTALFNALRNLGSIVSSLNNKITSNFEAIAKNVQSSCVKMENQIEDTTGEIKSILSTTNLKPSSEKMMQTFINGITSKKQSAVAAIKSVVSSIISQINNVISAANYTLKAFGSSERIETYSYAKGTNGHPGGNAVVNDGKGAELVQMPNGNTFIPKGRNVFIPNAPKGMKVLPAENTAALMGRNKPTFHYAGGTGDIDVWDYLDNAKGLVGRLKEKFVDYKNLRGAGLSIAKGAVTKITGAMVTWADKLFEEFGIGKGWKWPSLSRRITSPFGKRNSPGGIGSTNHKGIDIGAPFGSPVFASKGGTVSIAGWSGGYGNLVQINHGQGWSTRYGHNSTLLVSPGQRVRQGQTIALVGSTGNSTGPHIHFEIRRNGVSLNPLSMLGNGYANGGLVTKPGWIGEENKPEMVIPLSRSKRKRAISLLAQTGDMLGYTPENSVTPNRITTKETNTYAPQFTINISGTADDRATARKVKAWIQEALEDAFDSISRKQPRTQQV